MTLKSMPNIGSNHINARTRGVRMTEADDSVLLHAPRVYLEPGHVRPSSPIILGRVGCIESVYNRRCEILLTYDDLHSFNHFAHD